MKVSAMRYLIFSLFGLFFLSCASDYKMLKPAQPNVSCQSIILKSFSNQWYSASIDVVGKHLSGLLFIKKMDDGADRIVFTSEAGLTFFDFELKKDGSFEVHHIVELMNKRAVISTLKKDFELLLGKYFSDSPALSFSEKDELYISHNHQSETAHLIADKGCNKLDRIELEGKRKRKVTLKAYPDFIQTTDSLNLQHHNFDMKIKLIPIQKE